MSLFLSHLQSLRGTILGTFGIWVKRLLPFFQKGTDIQKREVLSMGAMSGFESRYTRIQIQAQYTTLHWFLLLIRTPSENPTESNCPAWDVCREGDLQNHVTKEFTVGSAKSCSSSSNELTKGLISFDLTVLCCLAFSSGSTIAPSQK